MALSPISPQELFLQPMSSDNEASQQQNPVRKRTNMSMKPLIPQTRLTAVVLNLFITCDPLKQSTVDLSYVGCVRVVTG